jgi:hypothetical protein
MVLTKKWRVDGGHGIEWPVGIAGSDCEGLFKTVMVRSMVIGWIGIGFGSLIVCIDLYLEINGNVCGEV